MKTTVKKNTTDPVFNEVLKVRGEKNPKTSGFRTIAGLKDLDD